MIQTLPTLSILTFILLAGAIAAAWASPIKIGKAAIAPWAALFLASLAGAVAAGIVQPAGLPILAVAIASAHAWRNADRSSLRLVFGAVLLLTIFALGTHKLPGFTNPIVLSGTFSQDAPPFTQYANYDKGAAGLILLAMVCRKSAMRDWGTTLLRALPIAAVATVAVLGSAVAIGYVRADIKLTETAAIFIAVNLFFTVIAEEALFRGFIQQQLTNFGHPAAFSIFFSAALFGAAHLGGGPAFAILATLAGLGYAWAYQAAGRIEAPILVHCAVNAIHFAFFTYPHLS
jgi:membrane protease YdiL (CAAX protease family)